MPVCPFAQHIAQPCHLKLAIYTAILQGCLKYTHRHTQVSSALDHLRFHVRKWSRTYFWTRLATLWALPTVGFQSGGSSMANAPAETPKLKGEAVGNLIRALQQGISWRPRRSRLQATSLSSSADDSTITAPCNVKTIWLINRCYN